MFSYSLFNLLWTKTEVSLNVFIGNIIITFLVWLKNNNSCHLTTLLQHDCPGTMFIPNLYIYYKTIAFIPSSVKTRIISSFLFLIRITLCLIEELPGTRQSQTMYLGHQHMFSRSISSIQLRRITEVCNLSLIKSNSMTISYYVLIESLQPDSIPGFPSFM